MPLTAPTLTVTGKSDTDIILTMSAPSGGTTPYQVFITAGSSPGDTDFFDGSSAVGAVDVSDFLGLLTPATTYYLHAYVIDDDGNGDRVDGDEIAVMTDYANLYPGTLTLVSKTATTATVSWDEATSGSGGGYRDNLFVNPPGRTIGDEDTGLTSPTVVEDLVANTEYEITLTVTDAVASEQEDSNTLVVTTDSGGPVPTPPRQSGLSLRIGIGL